MSDKKQQEKSPKRAVKIAETKMSKSDIEELMGMNKQTYTRRHGAIRNK